MCCEIYSLFELICCYRLSSMAIHGLQHPVRLAKWLSNQLYCAIIWIQDKYMFKSANVSIENQFTMVFKKVLVLYVGGTIGMRRNQDGGEIKNSILIDQLLTNILFLYSFSNYQFVYFFISKYCRHPTFPISFLLKVSVTHIYRQIRTVCLLMTS